MAKQQQNKPKQNKGGNKAASQTANLAAKNKLQMAQLQKSAFLSPKAQKRYIKSTASIQYGPERRQLQAEQRFSKQQQFRIPFYFKQYGKALKGIGKQTKRDYGAATKSFDASNQNLGTYAQTLQAQLNAQNQASASARGTTSTPDSAQLQGAVARYATGNTLGGVIKAQGASQRAYVGSQKAIGRREMIDAIQQESTRQRSYNQDLEANARSRGAAAAQAKQTLTANNRDFLLGLMAARNTRANALTAAKTSAANAALSAATTRRGQDITAADSKRTLKAAIARIRLDAKQGKITARQAQQRIRTTNRQFRKTHTPSGVGKGTISHTGSGASGIDKTHVFHIVSALNGLKGAKRKRAISDPSYAKAQIAGLSTTFTRAEVNSGYARWRKSHTSKAGLGVGAGAGRAAGGSGGGGGLP